MKDEFFSSHIFYLISNIFLNYDLYRYTCL